MRLFGWTPQSFRSGCLHALRASAHCVLEGASAKPTTLIRCFGFRRDRLRLTLLLASVVLTHDSFWTNDTRSRWSASRRAGYAPKSTSTRGRVTALSAPPSSSKPLGRLCFSELRAFALRPPDSYRLDPFGSALALGGSQKQSKSGAIR